jgi:FkbM family methyltransferase
LAVFPDAYYYLIEGNPECEIYLKELNVDYDIKLLSDEEKPVYFYTRIENPLCTGSSLFREKTPFYADEEIKFLKRRTHRLDDLNFNKNFDLIKIDTQGSELDIINGGLNTIDSTKGTILEVPEIQYNIGAPNKQTIFDRMEEMNFYPVETLGFNNHPIHGYKIQYDVLFINKRS